jgi:Tannase-like family of unknown function (DUF6351)
MSKGYAAASSTLNVFGVDCNSVLPAETTMMVKEHFIDEYGVPGTRGLRRVQHHQPAT